MKLGIMQPYFLPYIGYFQLFASVDVLIIYDNVKYTKKGWINRNRLLLNGTDATFTLPLKKGSNSLRIIERELAEDFDRIKLLNQFRGAYSNAPKFELIYPLLEQIIKYKETNLFRYVYHSIIQLCKYLHINTEIKISSEISIDHNLKSQEKVLALCDAVGADTYINPIGGIDLYHKNNFQTNGIDLLFIKSRPVVYPQFGKDFVPWLSMIDLLMFNSPDTVSAYINQNYDLI